MIITVFDIETTGVDKLKDQIIQFSAIKVDSNKHNIIDSINLYIQPTGSYVMSLGAYIKHHISPEFLKDKPRMSEVAQQIVDFLNVDTILTYNGNGFDIPFLKRELNKYGYDVDFSKKSCYDAFLEEKRRNGISLENTYKRYKGKTMEESGLTAHDALSDIKATYSVFVAQQRNMKYEPEKMYGEDNIICDMEYEGKIQPCFNVGKYRLIPVEQVIKSDKQYLAWCMSDKSNFCDSTKNAIHQLIEKYNKLNNE